MGLESYVVAIGKFKDLKELGLLDYPDDFYDTVKDEEEILVNLFFQNTTSSSRDLAQLLGCEPFDFSTHKIKSVNQLDYPYSTHWLGDDKTEEFKDIFKKVSEALKCDITIWFIPNG